MSAAGSEPEGGADALIEDDSDRRPTQMAYVHGTTVPWLFTIAWILALLALVAYLAVYAVPDLGKWGAP